jgi:hypothetical protein
MKLRALCCGLVLVTSAVSQNHSRTKDFVPDATTAVRVAEAVLIPVYEEKQIATERPFHATLKDDVWTVEGTLRCPDGKGGSSTVMCVGGTARVKLSKVDARILFMTHYK